MKTNLKVALSIIALAALVAAPAVAKSRTQERANTRAPAYQNDQVIVDIGADPDAHIRGEIRRDGLSYRY
jgi:Flp pilus assembly protein CpaB